MLQTPLNRVGRRRQKTRRVLLEVALGLFYEKGIYWTKVEDITERADVGKGTFYQNFSSLRCCFSSQPIASGACRGHGLSNKEVNTMKVYRLILGIAVPLAMVATVALANPAIMQKNKPGYPYPGTVAEDSYGGSALSHSIVEGNMLRGVQPGQGRPPTGTTSGKSLLPPKGDPLRISPSPYLEAEGFPLYGPDKAGSTAK